ncbi:MAG: holin [Clostridia bacterium]|nr:holin [Clostridia bacterium]
MNTINTIDLTPLAEVMISLLAVVITTYLIPWIKARTTATQQEHIRSCVQIAVYAAEKFYGAGKGDKKLEYAEKVLKEDFGIELDLNKLEAMIDAAIKDMEQKETPEIIEADPEKLTQEA